MFSYTSLLNILLVLCSFCESLNVVQAVKSSDDTPLILTPLIEQNKLSEAKNASKVQSSDFPNITSYSGFLTVNKQYNSNLFFWFFPAEEDHEQAPVILWLQGGPGSSSLFGLFIEHGPFIVGEDQKLTFREYSWSKKHNMIYVDNPAGTGFSFTTTGGYCRNETQIGNELYEALRQFFTLFAEIQNNDFYVAGESYAGKYVPAVSYAILKKNFGESLKINLKGLAIGDGVSDPVHQYMFSEYFYQLGLIDLETKNAISVTENKRREFIEKGEWTAAQAAFMAGAILFKEHSRFHNIYNYINEQDPTLPYQSYFSRYLNTDAMKKALHVGNLNFTLTSLPVSEALSDDSQQSVAPWISELLSNFKVLNYNGQVDLIVPYPSTLNYLQNLQFNGSEEYKKAPRQHWYAEEELAGYVKVAGNLTEVLVRNAGHMVPFDQPKWAYDLIYKFVRNLDIA